MTFTTTASNVNADTTTAAAGAGGGGGTAMMGPGPSFTDVTATLLARANDDYPHRRQCFTDGLESEQVAGGERVTQYGPGPWIQSGQLRYRSAVPIPESTPATHNIAANAHSHISSTATATATASTSVTLGTERKVRAYHICPFCGKNLSSTVPYSPLLLQTDAGDSDLWSGPPYKTAENSSIPFSHLPSPPSSSSVASVASVSQQLHSTSTSSSDLVKRAFLPGGALHSYLEGQGQGNEHGMALLRFPKVQRAR